jgi:hypothetical protein
MVERVLSKYEEVLDLISSSPPTPKERKKNWHSENKNLLKVQLSSVLKIAGRESVNLRIDFFFWKKMNKSSYPWVITTCTIIHVMRYQKEREEEKNYLRKQ